MLYPAATSADSPLAHMVVHPVQLALVVLFHPPTDANTALALGQLALCGGIYIYIYEHEAIQKTKSENNKGAPLALQKFLQKW